MHADRPLQRECAVGGSGACCSRPGRAAGLDADGRDRKTRGGEPWSPQRKNGSPVNIKVEELSGGTKGFTQHENRQRGSDCRRIPQRSQKEGEIPKTYNRSTLLQSQVQEACVQTLPPHQRLHYTCIFQKMCAASHQTSRQPAVHRGVAHTRLKPNTSFTRENNLGKGQ